MTRRRMAAALAVVLAAAWWPMRAFACGDKFLVTSRGTRFQRAGLVRRPASILVYARPDSRWATAIATLQLPGALSKVGYTATIVTTPAAFDAASQRGSWDLVVVELADAAILGAPPPGSAPPVVVVAYDAAGDVLRQARRIHAGVLRSPTRARAVVDTIDDVLFTRALRAPKPAASGN